MVLLENKFKKEEGLVVEKVDDSYLILSPKINDQGVYLSNIAAEVFDLCDGTHTVLNIVTSIQNMYDVTIEECKTDIYICIEDLLKANILVLC